MPSTVLPDWDQWHSIPEPALPKHTQPNAISSLKGGTKKPLWLRQTQHQHQREAAQTQAGLTPPKARGVTWGERTTLFIARNMENPSPFGVPTPMSLWDFLRKKQEMNPKGHILPCPQPPLPRAGRGPGTYHSWAILTRGRQGRQDGAAAGVVQELSGGTSTGTQLGFEGAAPPSRGSCEWGR